MFAIRWTLCLLEVMRTRGQDRYDGIQGVVRLDAQIGVDTQVQPGCFPEEGGHKFAAWSLKLGAFVA